MGFGGGGSGLSSSPIFSPSTVESNSTAVVDDTEQSTSAGTVRQYAAPFILPATSKFWLITGIEWKNGTLVAGNILTGLDKIGINTDPPTAVDTELVAYATDLAQAGVSVIQRNSIITQTRPLGKGDIVIPWWSASAIGGRIRYLTVGASNYNRTLTDDRSFPTWKTTVAWGATTAKPYMKVYFTGYG